MRRLLFAALLCLTGCQAQAQGGATLALPGVVFTAPQQSGDPAASLLTPSRNATANWQRAGLLSIGGIPTRTTQCGPTLSPSGGDDTSAMQAAINACPVGQVVVLGAGTFLESWHGTTVHINKSITVRGQGGGVTSVHSPNGAVLNNDNNGTHVSTIFQIGGSASVTTVANLTADGAKGANSIQVASSSGFSVGGLVLVDELAIGKAMPDCCFNSGNGTVWAEPDYRVEWNQHSPAVQFFDSACNGYGNNNNFACGTNGDECAYSIRCGGVTEELHLITAISGNTITFDSPLTISYRVANTAQAHSYAPGNLVTQAGLENLTVSNGDEGNIVFSACVYCWAHNVESTQWLNAGGVAFYQAAFRDQVDGSWVHDAAWPVNGGGGYAINLTYGASEILVTNNIVMKANKVDVVRASGAGSVFSYNYMDDGYINGQDGWVETGLNCSHLAGSHHVLFEGNQSWNTDNDFTHGATGHCTFFRNWLTGFRAPFVALDGKAVNDLTQSGNGPKRAIGDHAYAYWDSFVGNVAGTPGQMGGWQLRCESGGADSNCGPGTIYNLGWNDTSVAGSLGDASMAIDYPAQPTNTITGPGCLTSGESCAPIRDGNFDFKTNAIQWASNDTAHTLPPSFYLTQPPAFFSAGKGYAWPWVTPEQASQLQVLPAKARWDAGTPFKQP
jgi:hypothetical protein